MLAAGLDSLGAVELRNSLEGSLQVQLPGTLVFDYPTISALQQFLLTKAMEHRQSMQHVRGRGQPQTVAPSASKLPPMVSGVGVAPHKSAVLQV